MARDEPAMKTTAAPQIAVTGSNDYEQCDRQEPRCPDVPKIIERPESFHVGQKQTYAVHNGMSALPPKTDMCGRNSR